MGNGRKAQGWLAEISCFESDGAIPLPHGSGKTAVPMNFSLADMALRNALTHTSARDYNDHMWVSVFRFRTKRIS